MQRVSLLMKKSVFERLLSLETPVYYYDMDLFRKTVDLLAETATAHGVKVHYAVKTNNEERIMRYIASKGLGADCVSGNEIAWAVRCGFPPDLRYPRRDRGVQLRVPRGTPHLG